MSESQVLCCMKSVLSIKCCFKWYESIKLVPMKYNDRGTCQTKRTKRGNRNTFHKTGRIQENKIKKERDRERETEYKDGYLQ
jgi:hypothetical protein